MERTKVEEAVAVGDGEIRRGKRVNDGEDTRLAKKAKVESNKAAELTIYVGDKTKNDNVVNDDEVNRLRLLLADDPKKLNNKELVDVIRYLEVDEIVSLTLKSGQRQGSACEDGDTEEAESTHEDDSDAFKILDTLKSMVCYIERVKKPEFLLLLSKLPRVAFTALLLTALEPYRKRWSLERPLSKEDLDMIPELCCILPSKLFAHVLCYKASLWWLPELEETSEELDGGESVIEKAAERCGFCGSEVGKAMLARPSIDDDNAVWDDEVVMTSTMSDDTTSTVSDDTTSIGEETKAGNAASADEVERLRQALADGPKKMSEKDIVDVIQCLKVDEIVTLALESVDDKDSDEENPWLCYGGPIVPSPRRVLVLLRTMLRHIEKLKEADFWVLYQNFPKAAFVTLLLVGLDSHNNRCPLQQLEALEREKIKGLCRVLPWKLFAHVLSRKTCLGHILNKTYTTNAVQKRAAERCGICFGKGVHSGLYGDHCSFWDSVPKGAAVGYKYLIFCADCGKANFDPFPDDDDDGLRTFQFFDECQACGSEAMRACHINMDWKI